MHHLPIKEQHKITNPYGRRSEPPGNLSQNNRINFNLYVVTLWIDGERGFCPSAPLGVLFRAESVGASLEAPVAPPCADRKSTRNGGISFGVYAVIMDRFHGRLKRRPYKFCFYVVLLWINSANDFCPSAPLGLLLSVVTKVTKNTLLSTAQEGIKMTALRGKSRISLPLRLHIS